MKTLAMLCLALVLTIGGVLLWGLGTFNVLIENDEAVNAAWAQVQNVYQRRLDLIPNLVETVKGVAKFERETLREVAQARAAATGVTMDAAALKDPKKFEQFQAAQGSLGGTLSRLLVSLEKYPELKAIESFRELQDQLRETEDRITVERSNFNEVAAVFNSTIRKMPASLVAARSGMKARPYFKAEEAAAQAPKVAF